MDKLNAISLFCKVIETQSFTQAAAQSNISLAMASKLVAQLEAHLNVRLLQRTTRKITPTEAGLLYYQRCLPILSDLNEAEECVSNITSTLQGRLVISLPMDFGSRFVAPHLGQFMETYPHLQLQLEFNDRRVDVVAEGYDLVLRIGKLEDSSIVAKKIGQTRHVLLASPTYLAKYGTPTSVEALEDHACLVYEIRSLWDFIDTRNGKSHKFRPKTKLLSNNGYALLQMAKSHQGIVNIPRFLAKDELASGELIEVLPHLSQPDLAISLLYPHRRYLSPKVKVLIEYLSELMRSHQAFL